MPPEQLTNAQQSHTNTHPHKSITPHKLFTCHKYYRAEGSSEGKIILRMQSIELLFTPVDRVFVQFVLCYPFPGIFSSIVAQLVTILVFYFTQLSVNVPLINGFIFVRFSPDFVPQLPPNLRSKPFIYITIIVFVYHHCPIASAIIIMKLGILLNAQTSNRINGTHNTRTSGIDSRAA